MDFLLKYDFSNDEIEEISDKVDANLIKNILENLENVEEVIEYLFSLGITSKTLKKLFLKQIGIFFRSKDELVTVFDEYEIESIVKSLNYDVNTVDLIEF